MVTSVDRFLEIQGINGSVDIRRLFAGAWIDRSLEIVIIGHYCSLLVIIGPIINSLYIVSPGE